MKDPLTTEDAARLLQALLVDRPMGVPDDVLRAEGAHVTDWARDVLIDHSLLQMVLRGELAIKIVEGEMRFRARNREDR